MCVYIIRNMFIETLFTFYEVTKQTILIRVVYSIYCNLILLSVF